MTTSISSEAQKIIDGESNKVSYREDVLTSFKKREIKRKKDMIHCSITDRLNEQGICIPTGCPLKK